MRRPIAILLSLLTLAAAPIPSDAKTKAMLQRWGDARAGELIEEGLNAVHRKDLKRAKRLSVELQAAYPNEPARFVIDFAAAASVPSSYAATLFVRMAAERATVLSSPLPLIDPKDVRTASYVATGQDNLRMARALLNSRWSSGPAGQEQTVARRTLIDDALQRHAVADAATLLDGLDDPFTLRDMLILDKYQPLQSTIITRWSADLSGLDRERGERLTTSARDQSPTALAFWAEWLISHGRTVEAWTVVRPAISTNGLLPFDRSIVILTAARAAVRAGSSEEALALIDRFTAPLEPDDVVRISVLTAKAVMLGDLERPTEALILSKALQRAAYKDHGWIEASLKRIEVCATADMGDTEGAHRQLAVLMDFGGAELFKAQALLCLGETEPATAITAGALKRHDALETLRWLQRQPEPSWGKWQKRWNNGFALMGNRSELVAALAGYAVIRNFAVREVELE